MLKGKLAQALVTHNKLILWYYSSESDPTIFHSSESELTPFTKDIIVIIGVLDQEFLLHKERRYLKHLLTMWKAIHIQTSKCLISPQYNAIHLVCLL